MPPPSSTHDESQQTLAGFALGAGVFQFCSGRRVQSKAAEILIAGALVGVIAFASGPAVVLSIPLFAALVALLHSEAGPVAKLLSTATLRSLGRMPTRSA